jgi:hypothetical protein
MKKSILTLAIYGICSLTVLPNCGFAQTNNKEQRLIDPKILLGAAKLDDPSGNERTRALSLKEVNTKALRDFRKAFKGVSNEEWFPIAKGYSAEFTAKSIRSTVVYDNKGNWKFTISRYGEYNLPAEIRAAIKATYYDYSITLVEEIHEIHVQDKIVYVVHMENENTWKNVRVCDGEMELIEDFNKR